MLFYSLGHEERKDGNSVKVKSQNLGKMQNSAKLSKTEINAICYCNGSSEKGRDHFQPSSSESK